MHSGAPPPPPCAPLNPPPAASARTRSSQPLRQRAGRMPAGGGGEAWRAEFPEAEEGAGPGAGWGDWQGGGGYAPLAAGEGAWETFGEAEASAAGPAVRPKEEAEALGPRRRREWRALAGDADVWDSPARARLATQARAGARVAALSGERPGGSVLVRLAEDGYKGYLAERDWEAAEPSAPPEGGADAEAEAAGPELRRRAVRFALEAEARPNAYKWGGTLGPDFDCSGLVQSAFASQGLMLPRDAYQQSTFAGVEPVAASELQPGDLIFFGPGPPNSREGALRINHVALCVRGGDRRRRRGHAARVCPQLREGAWPERHRARFPRRKSRHRVGPLLPAIPGRRALRAPGARPLRGQPGPVAERLRGGGPGGEGPAAALRGGGGCDQAGDGGGPLRLRAAMGEKRHGGALAQAGDRPAAGIEDEPVRH